MNPQANTPLTAVPGWTEAQVRKLAGHWITTAEQVVGVAGTEDGVRSLADLLGTSTTEAGRLVESARAALPPAVAAELTNPVDTSRYGLGALPPRDPS
jgi:hypothetical protein